MSNAIHPLDFDEQRLEDYYRTRDALTALVEGRAYRLLPIPGTELCEACAACGEAHAIQACPEIRAELMR